MIDIKELRIGNFVMTNNSKYRKEQNGKVAYITQIDSERQFEETNCTVSIYLLDDKWKDTYGQWLIFIEPIPITEEWLLKFGFKKEPSYWINDSFEIKDYGDGSFRYGINFFEYGIGECFKYVHQLQNLYFAINQTELNYEF